MSGKPMVPSDDTLPLGTNQKACRFISDHPIKLFQYGSAQYHNFPTHAKTTLVPCSHVTEESVDIMTTCLYYSHLRSDKICSK